MLSDPIRVIGARQNNLKNITLALPRHKLIVFCGWSGSGKSSLAFDTIYAEGFGSYVESLSTYIRQFLPKLPRPQVDDRGIGACYRPLAKPIYEWYALYGGDPHRSVSVPTSAFC